MNPDLTFASVQYPNFSQSLLHFHAKKECCVKIQACKGVNQHICTQYCDFFDLSDKAYLVNTSYMEIVSTVVHKTK